MSKYSVYTGKFPCHTCKEVVSSLRLYSDTKTVTWMCSEKHMSEVLLVANKRKKHKDIT
jgi:hypothetical protein